jgi:type I restriction enzyme S subunit
MASEWNVAAFADVIDFQEGPGILAKDFREHGVPLVRLSGLDRGASLLAGCNYLDPVQVAKKWAHFALQKGDILLSTSALLGRIAVVDDEGVGAIAYTGIIRMRPRDDRLVAPFIRYLLEGSSFQQQVEAFGVGSVIRHFGPMHLRQMTVLLPPPNEQRAIAHILGTLDDKIELNRKQNETLEAMARALFKAWFVDFEPVRAKMEGRWQRGQSLPGLPAHLYDLFPDRLVESELGEIPEGWEVISVDSEFDITMGQSPPGTTYNEIGEGLPFYQGRADFEFRFPKRRVFEFHLRRIRTI